MRLGGIRPGSTCPAPEIASPLPRVAAIWPPDIPDIAWPTLIGPLAVTATRRPEVGRLNVVTSPRAELLAVAAEGPSPVDAVEIGVVVCVDRPVCIAS